MHCLFIDFEKAFDRVPTQELLREKVPEKYVRIVQDLYLQSKTAVICNEGKTEFFPVEVGVHQGSALNCLDHLIDNVRWGAPWNILFADDIMLCAENVKNVELHSVMC